MAAYKPSLNMSQFKKIKREHNEEELQAAIQKASARYMEPEILHDVKVAGIIKDSVKFNENNPTWLQFGLIFENAAGEVANQYFMIPCGGELNFTGRTGNVTAMPLANYGNFLQCMGLFGMGTVLVDRIIETNCEVLEGLIGFQLRYIAKWNKKKLHAQYDSEQQAWFLVDYKGQLMREEPFQLPSKDEVETPEQRWAELVVAAQEEGFAFESSANGQILPAPGIVNPIAQLGINPAGNDRAAIKAAHEQSVPKTQVAKPTTKAATGVAKPKLGLLKKTPTPPPAPEPEEEEEAETGEGEFDSTEFDQEQEVDG